MHTLRRATERRFVVRLEYWIAFAAILALIATVAVVFDALSRLAHEVDNTDRLLTRQTAQAAVASFSARLRDSHQDYAYWDDAALKFHGIPEPGFVDENLRGGSELATLFDTAFLVDEKGNDLAAFHGGVPVTTASRDYFGKTLHRLIRDIDVDGVQVHTGFAATPDGIAAVAVGPVRPFTESVRVPEGERRLLVFANHLSADRVAKLRQEFVIPGLALADATTTARRGFTLFDPNGEAIAAVNWTTRSPGRVALAQIGAKVRLMLVLLAVAIVAILAVTWSNIRRSSLHQRVAEHAARHDFLTGLANRAALVEILEQQTRSGSGYDSEVAILYFDLDGFKHINDTHGHDAGDRLLQMCARKFVELVAGRGVAARVGGDEFVILVPGAGSLEVADDIAQAILAFCSAPVVVDGNAVRISTSIGLAHRPAREFGAVELLKRADTAMYEAKRRGGNTIARYDRDGAAAHKLPEIVDSPSINPADGRPVGAVGGEAAGGTMELRRLHAAGTKLGAAPMRSRRRP